MNPEEVQRHNDIVKLNHQTKLFDNLKSHISGLFSQTVSMLKDHVFTVKVENPQTVVSIDNQVDPRRDIALSADRIVSAIKEIPEQKETDMTCVKEPLEKLVEIFTPKPAPKVKVEMPPKFIHEELIYDDDYNLIKVIRHFDKMDIVEERVKTEKGYKWITN